MSEISSSVLIQWSPYFSFLRRDIFAKANDYKVWPLISNTVWCQQLVSSIGREHGLGHLIHTSVFSSMTREVQNLFLNLPRFPFLNYPLIFWPLIMLHKLIYSTWETAYDDHGKKGIVFKMDCDVMSFWSRFIYLVNPATNEIIMFLTFRLKC